MQKMTTADLGANAANLFPGAEVEFLGGARYLILTADGAIRFLADEGDGSFEGEDSFEEAWEQANP